jgi:hypothetical protein
MIKAVHDLPEQRFWLKLSANIALLMSLGCSVRGNAKMSIPPNTVHIEVKAVTTQPASVVIRYTVKNNSAKPIHLVQGPRMPYLRRSEGDQVLLDVWMGVPPMPKSTPSLTGIFELPSTREVAAGAVESLEAVLKKPFELTEHFSSKSKPLDVGPGKVKARLIVGYGFSLISPVGIDRMEKLLEWQSTAFSEPFDMPIAE